MNKKYSHLYVYNILENHCAEIIRYLGDEEHLQIPNSIDGYLVTSIATKAFSYLHDCFGNVCSVKTIVVPETVSSVGSHAFEYNIELESVVFLNPLTYIDQYAFAHCSSLTSVQLPYSLTEISPHLFENCSSLKHIDIPITTECIGMGAFNQCSTLESIELPLVNKICASAFSYCEKLEDVVFSLETYEIGARAFENCISLYEVVLPDSITRIDDEAFSKCSALSYVMLPASLSFLGKGVFFGCKFLENVKLPQNNPHYTFVGNSLFEVATKTLVFYSAYNEESSYRIPHGTIRIMDKAFSGNMSLTDVNLPSSVKDFSAAAFYRCSNLFRLSFYEKNSDFLIRNNVVFKKTTKELLFFPPSSFVDEYNIPPGTESIGECAFSENYFITTVNIPDSVHTIGKEAFSGSGISELFIPSSVKTIKEHAFSFCGSLTRVDLPDTIECIEPSTFEFCYSIKSISIPKSVKAIFSKAFEECTSLESVQIPGGVMFIEDDAFPEDSETTMLVEENTYAQDFAQRHGIKYAII